MATVLFYVICAISSEYYTAYPLCSKLNVITKYLNSDTAAANTGSSIKPAVPDNAITNIFLGPVSCNIYFSIAVIVSNRQYPSPGTDLCLHIT